MTSGGKLSARGVANLYCMVHMPNASEKQLNALAQIIEEVWNQGVEAAQKSIPTVATSLDEIKKLSQQDPWGSHPVHPRSVWQSEVSTGSTQLGYWEWVARCIEAYGQ